MIDNLNTRAPHSFILKHRGAHCFGIKLMKPDSLASIMNWSKNLYVFMLGALIVFSGCIGTGTTDGEGDADTAGTTVINNYYYNNTTEIITELPEMIAIGGVGWGANQEFDFVNTTPGELVQIHEANFNHNISTMHNSNEIIIISNCSNGEFQTEVDGIGTSEEGWGTSGTQQSAGPYYIPGSFTDCTHTLATKGSETWYGWSLVYSIVPVTVG